MIGYAVVIEGEEGSYSAWSPELPGCVATGRTLDEVKQRMREAIQFHLEGLRLDGEAAPPPSAVATTVIPCRPPEPPPWIRRTRGRRRRWRRPR